MLMSAVVVVVVVGVYVCVLGSRTQVLPAPKHYGLGMVCTRSLPTYPSGPLRMLPRSIQMDDQQVCL